MLLTLALLSVLFCSSSAQDPSISARFKSYFRLHESPLYELYWSTNVTGNRIRCGVRVQTRGWVGFGISINGMMLNSDIVMGFVDDTSGAVTFTDRRAHPSIRQEPTIDAQQDWNLVSGTQDGVYTILDFSRLLDTGDTTGDLVIGETVNLIFAWSGDDRTNTAHTNTTRGNKLGARLFPSASPTPGPTTPPTAAVTPPTNATATPTAAATPPSNATTTPTDATTPPSNATTPPTDATTPPTDATTPPTDATTPPTDATTPPTNATTPPTDATTPPTNATTPPTDATTAPTDGTTAPTDGTTAPTDGTTAPTDGTTAPTDGTTPPPTTRPPTCPCTNVQECTAGYAFDHASCQCVCAGRTSEDIWYDKYYECQRDYYKIFSIFSCGCECPKYIKCPGNLVVDPKTCACRCPTTSCASPKQLDPYTCDCQCPYSHCRPYFNLDHNTCQCKCSRSCRDYEVLDTKYCECRRKPVTHSPTRPYTHPAPRPPYHDGQCSHLSTEYYCNHNHYRNGVSCQWVHNKCQPRAQCCRPRRGRYYRPSYYDCASLSQADCSNPRHRPYCSWYC